MPTSPPLPEPIESELLRLLDGPEPDFWPGVARLCQQHPSHSKELVREAERMQAAAQGERPTAATTTAPDRGSDDLEAGDRVGQFVILGEIGHGGMGSVYHAEQKEPVRRRVALKVIKLGMDTKAVLARFEAERQALAMMDHSHIARVLEAGVTPKGRPFFAMEYVKGVPITRYCDEHKLSLDDRLALFKQVCSGVQHAHTKGVIHRDLTPNNVLVTLQDGKPTAKIIDFGLARATDHRLTEKTLFTEQGVILGTPEYMSPEQAGLDALDVDMRSDVYTLGVLLYELLTGRLPFDGKTLRADGYDAMCKTIREADPPKPSTRVSTHVGGTDAAARLRRTDSGSLLKRLRGDLDWVVLKCLEKDRTRRYATVTHLADDVQRHLDSEPVMARAPSVAYRFAKFARRYRGRVMAASAVFAALVVGLLVAVYFWHGATTARDREAAKVREFHLLADGVHLTRLRTELRDLAKPWRTLVAAERWLSDASRLLTRRADLEAALAKLEKQATPETPEDESTRGSSPTTKWTIFEQEKERASAAMIRRRRTLLSLNGLIAVSNVAASGIALPDLSAIEKTMTPQELSALAWEIVDPATHHADKQLSMTRALALVVRAWGRNPPTDCGGQLANSLAWAWFWCGEDRYAEESGQAAVELSTGAERLWLEASVADLNQRVRARRGKTSTPSPTESATPAQVVEKARSSPPRRPNSLRFESEEQQILHYALTQLLAELSTFDAREYSGMAARIRCAKVASNHPRARVGWQLASESILRADGEVASTLYRDHPVRLQPQLGLVPIGMNPATKLWEFYELHSAWDPSTTPDPASLEIPTHGPDGRIQVDAATGIVLVLLPGGSFVMGAQKDDENAPNYDRGASNFEGPPQRMTLAPFFLARHETTREQWRRLGGKLAPSSSGETDTFPIRDLDWFTGDARLRASGLALPTEAQWEYGCRATTITPWWMGRDPEALGDEFKDHFRPVGTLRANPFGLFDVHGGAMEWCEDEWVLRPNEWRSGDGLLGGSVDSGARACRGGVGADQARSAHRGSSEPANRWASVRASRPIILDD